jgi:hypothetical protein
MTAEEVGKKGKKGQWSNKEAPAPRLNDISLPGSAARCASLLGDSDSGDSDSGDSFARERYCSIAVAGSAVVVAVGCCDGGPGGVGEGASCEGGESPPATSCKQWPHTQARGRL